MEFFETFTFPVSKVFRLDPLQTSTVILPKFSVMWYFWCFQGKGDPQLTAPRSSTRQQAWWTTEGVVTWLDQSHRSASATSSPARRGMRAHAFTKYNRSQEFSLCFSRFQIFVTLSCRHACLNAWPLTGSFTVMLSHDAVGEISLEQKLPNDPSVPG